MSRSFLGWVRDSRMLLVSLESLALFLCFESFYSAQLIVSLKCLLLKGSERDDKPVFYHRAVSLCFLVRSGAWLSYPDLKYKDGNSQEVKWMYVTDRNSFWVRKVRPAQKCFKPDSFEQSSGSIEIYEKMSPLLSAPMTSTNTFLMCLWIQSPVSILTKYNMMLIR